MIAQFRENLLLPLVICVLLPGMAGAWFRYSHTDLPQQAIMLETTGMGSEGAWIDQSCAVPPKTAVRAKKSEEAPGGTVAVTVPVRER